MTDIQTQDSSSGTNTKVPSSDASDVVDFHPTAIQVATAPNDNRRDGAISREVMKTLFGENVGELINDFSCAVESTVLLHGRMYLTNKCLCFYSNLFGLEKRVFIPYANIVLITKENTAVVIPNAIAVTSSQNYYLFRSFWDRDECFRLLKECISRQRFLEHACDIPANDEQISRQGSFETPTSSTSRPLTTRISSLSSVSSKERPTSTPQLTNSSDSNHPISTSNVSISPSPDRTRINPEEETDIETSLPLINRSAAYVDNAAQYLVEVTKSKLKIVVATPEPLPISLKDFMSLFVDDDAPYSWKVYHESVGDTKVLLSNWTFISSDLGSQREMKFLKPLPSIKSSTRGLKVQRYRKFEEYGVVICGSTRLEDVPAADSFSVEDMIAVKTIGENKISLEISFEVKFVKSTMFRYVIESSTNSEMKIWLEQFYNKVKSISLQKLEPKPTELINSIPDSVTAAEIPNPTIETTHLPPPEVSGTPLLNKLATSQTRVFWVCWAILAISFLFFGYQCLRVSSKLYNIEMRMQQLQNSLDVCARQK